MSKSSGLRSVFEVDEAMHPGVDLAAGPCRAKMTFTPRSSQKSRPDFFTPLQTDRTQRHTGPILRKLFTESQANTLCLSVVVNASEMPS